MNLIIRNWRKWGGGGKRGEQSKERVRGGGIHISFIEYREYAFEQRLTSTIPIRHEMSTVITSCMGMCVWCTHL